MSEHAPVHSVQVPAPQPAATNGFKLQRKCACGSYGNGGECNKCRGEKTELQRRAPGATDPAAMPAVVHDVLGSAGQPLDAGTRAWMEPRFGYDFSSVRVHTDARASESARSIGALAYTVGKEMVFGRDQYAPHSLAGQHLVAHELAHVVQQNDQAPHDSPIQLMSAPRFEREADRAAEGALRGAAIPRLSSIASPAVQREAAAGHQSTPAPTVRRERQSIPNTGRGGGRFDAVLDRQNSLLEITMRVAFNFENVRGPWNQPWTPERKAQWKSEFIRATIARWSNRYVLVPNGPCPTEAMSAVRVAINVLEDTAQPHFVLKVDNQETLQGSGVSTVERQGNLHVGDVTRTFHSDAGQFQVVAEHEFGHMLGVHHIHCLDNQPECYGVGPNARPEEARDVMGAGSEVSKQDYEVFAEILQASDVTGCRWKVEENSSALEILGWIGAGVLGAGLAGLGIAAAAGAFRGSGR